MAQRLRELRAPLVDPNQENFHTKVAAIKGALVKPAVLPTRRPALGEVGNKIATAITSKLAQKKTQLHRVDSLVPLKHAVKPSSKPETQSTNLIKLPPKPVTRSTVLINSSSSTSYSTKQLDIIDWDEEESSDPCMVSEYVQDIYRYLHELEEKYPVKASFLVGHHSTPKMRTVLMNWLVQVHGSFHLCLEVVHMTTSIIDRYLQVDKTIGRQNLQLVGVAALYIACKYEEMFWPDISEFVHVSDETFSARQILAMEREILKRLEFNLGKPLSVHFLRRYSKVAEISSVHHTLSKYILELALLEDSLSSCKPSLLAAAACFLSIAVLDENLYLTKIWNQKLEYVTTYKYEDLKPVLMSFAAMILKTETSKYSSVKEKYASGKYQKISLNDKLKGKVILKLSIHTPVSVTK